MNAFDIAAGVVSFVAFIFAIIIFLNDKRKEAVETQKAAEYQQRLADNLSMVNSIAQQGTLIAAMSDREEVSKKEIKHLVISQLATVKALQDSVSRVRAVESRWKFGVPVTYLRIDTDATRDGQRSDDGVSHEY